MLIESIMQLDEKIISIDADDTNDVSYVAFNDFLEVNTMRKKNIDATHIEALGEKLIKEIEKKKIIQSKEKLKYSKYIAKHSGRDIEDLMSYEISDVREIYNELRKSRESKIKNFFNFLFNS